MPYSEMFKNNMIHKLTGPGALSAGALSKQVDVPQSTLSSWLRQAGVESPYVYANTSQAETTMREKPPKNWSSQKKFQVVLEAASLSDENLGAFLRSKGLHETHLEQWRLQMLDGLEKVPLPKKTKRSPADAKKIRVLEKELRRKDKALAETAALLVLKKKVQEIWGDEDEGTSKKNGKWS